MLGFRVWDTFTNTCVDANDFQLFCNDSGELIVPKSIESNVQCLANDRFIAMQSTGQLDIEENMIYEKDIVSTFQNVFVCAHTVMDFYITCLTHKLSGFKVIGNVYENPGLELLEKVHG